MRARIERQKLIEPPVAEVNSWNNSLRAISQVFQTASLLDHGVLLELQLPLTSKRLDCLVTGYDSKKAPNAVIIELKQWSGCKGASGKNEVATFVGGGVRDVLYPSVQVGQYMTYLTDCHTAFQGEDGISAHACSYLHNYSPIKGDPLFLPQFAEQIRRSPVFTSRSYWGSLTFMFVSDMAVPGLCLGAHITSLF